MDIKLQVSAAHFGIQLHNLGKGKHWDNYFTKNECYIAELKQLKQKYDYVLGVDARDVLFFDTLQAIIDTYNTYYSGKLVFNAEDFTGKAASYDLGTRTTRVKYENHRLNLPYTSANKYKYLNSGCFMGPIDLVITAMQAAYAYKDKWGNSVDNGPMEEVYLSSNYIVLDEQCRIFQIMSENESGGVNFDLVYKQGKPYNRHTDTYPKILHAAGHSHFIQAWRILTGNYY